MINPNATHIQYGLVLAIDHERKDIKVKLPNGTELNGLGFPVLANNIKVGDTARVVIGFRITSDSYGVESAALVTPSRVTNRLVEHAARLAYVIGVRCEWIENLKTFRVNGADVKPRNIFVRLGLQFKTN